MGILNLTPDSFSGDGLLDDDSSSENIQLNLDLVLEKAKYLVENGADIIDVGGESTRPGAQQVSAESEIEACAPGN